jgi:predicted nucleic acid-binding protein
MKIVLDINALLVSIPKHSSYRLIFDSLIVGEFILIISNDILSEYIEIIQSKANVLVANNIAEMLLNLENVKR